jgi:O-6-methylguanine DNA methyltransferase
MVIKLSVSLEGLRDFQRRVLTLLTKIPRGKVATYGEIAKALGDLGLSRAVGNAVRNNPFAPTVPCHRVVRSSGNIGGFDGETSGEKVAKKIKMLQEEGVAVDSAGKIDLEKYLVRGEDLRKSLILK